ncbi:hypothetical protein BSKO_01637 [Bryopsis sp. KO-2023]|nr:hypothetical protein BSKO_01637 [Bryopsis sp. KO-2023]
MDAVSAGAGKGNDAAAGSQQGIGSDVRVFFVLGGPGSGKGTQCLKLVEQYGCTHLSAGDLLREEVKSGSETGKKCEELMTQGKLVPMDVTIGLLKKAMIESGAKNFLIDGFPRALDQAKAFAEQVKECEMVLFLDCPEDVMQKRLMSRSQTSGRVDDNAETIQKRFKTFVDASMPVVEYYRKLGRCITVSAVPDTDDVFAAVQDAVGNHLHGLLPQPVCPTGKVVVLECKGGSDKGPDGHRRDTIPICNSLIKQGWAAKPLFYTDATHDQVFEEMSKLNGFLCRVNPGKYDGVTQSKLDDMCRKLASKGVAAMSHPEVMKKMGAKDALLKIKDLSCGMSDTFAYYDIPSFKENFPKTVATGTRVLKQNRGSQGEGIWVVKVKAGNSGPVNGSTLLDLQEAVDNHKEEKTVDEFMKFCEQYIEGDDGQLIDQRFLPRIVEGELRVNMIYDTPTEIVHKKPVDGGISATLASGAKYVSYKPDDPQFAVLMDNFINKDLPKIMPALGMNDEPIPLIWTSDFILGEKTSDGKDTYFVGEFNCSCVGITQQLYLADPVAQAAIKIMTAGKCTPLLPQPSNPVGSAVVLECMGGSDKGADGHRRDTIPICNSLIKKGWAAKPLFYTDATHDQVFEEMSKLSGFLCRVNPGKYDGVTQSKLDDMCRKLASKGVAAMSHPEVMKKMGAKDALLKIKDLSCGMSDTFAYYDIPSFKENFPKTVATGTRVLKQNRGSQGEGIWVVKVKAGSSGPVNGSTLLDLQEAVDNHKEEKTVDEFMKFCEQYIEGDDGQLIDQRFLPRIVEGELRVNMIYDTPTEIVHKKPVDGGISATLASGAKYVSYKPDDPQFAVLMDNFINKDLPKIMPALGMDGEPIPLIWTSDFILGEKTSDGKDTYFVGEFNCSCVGITQQLYLADPVAEAAIKIMSAGKCTQLLPQPEKPVGSAVVLECKGGSDKGPDGHRRDTIPICNSLIKKGWAAKPLFYTDATHDKVFEEMSKLNGFLCRVNPGKYDGVTQSKLDDMCRKLASKGVAAMSHPEVMKKMGAKDALLKIKDLSCGMSDTFAYYDIPSFKENFPKTVATGTRVLKQNRGSQGEGIWVVKVKAGNSGPVNGSTLLDLQEAVDNHKEEKTVDEFMKFCEQYIEGDDGQLIDQRFLPRIVEGELRVNMIYDTPTEIVHKKPVDGGISATLASGAKYVSYKPDDPQFAVLMDNFINKDLPKIMPALGMDGEPIPLIWTSDFILGEKTSDGKDTYFVGEFNCSCVGITQQLYLADPVAEAAIKIMSVGKCTQLLPQPEKPVGSAVVLECKGGSDKGPDGHRRDTIPICNSLIKKGWAAKPLFYTDATHDQVFEEMSKLSGFLCRVNPGKYDGVTQSKLDDMCRKLASKGVAAMSHPEVMKKMGAKDALLKIKDLSCGMSDTFAYYDIPSFKENFPKTVATGTRVLKQNRGSQGEGIWVVKVKAGSSGPVNGSTLLDLQEAVDNHKEEKTVDEFMKFCEQYIEGDDGQLIDQRFLPRIVEGELRVNMIYDTPTEIVHKKPVDGGISATLASGAKYVSYKPDDPQFAVLMDNFINKDLPKIMPALGMDGEPIPLIWTSDFILGEKTSDGKDTYFVGEFNCSCVGITQQLYLADPVAQAAIKIMTAGKGTQLLPQPSNPVGSAVVLECMGGSDKGADGHRRDTIPICNSLIKKGWAAKPLFYTDATHDQVFEEMSKLSGFLCRVNPGKYDGVTQSKLDDMCRNLASKGVAAMSHPEVMKKMGAKDALLKIKDLSCGMSDTFAYYDIPSFKENFPKTVATGTRVLKQNRGSQGEGIWVVKVKEDQSGDVTGDTLLNLQEAVDNHKEEKTVDEFMKFCEQYIEGEDGQLIDQRFLPRIVEGELRVNMIYDTPTEIVHKKPVDGGISATLASGAKYVSYKPDDPQFAVLMDNFINKDLPKIMPALGMDGEPIPLIWTSDFILGEKTSDGADSYFVGEFNCSCVGITQQLYLADPVADAAIKIMSKQ